MRFLVTCLLKLVTRMPVARLSLPSVMDRPIHLVKRSVIFKNGLVAQVVRAHP